MQGQGQGLDALNVKRHLLDVEQYHRMGDAGVFAPDARVELIEGELIDMAPMSTRHFAAVNRLNHLLTQAIGGRAIVSTQLPLRLNARSEPEPDISVLKLRDDFYESALPTGVDTFLVIEVSDSTLAYDLRIKAGLYARHGVPEYWVVDLPSRVLRVFRAAGPHGYRDATELPSPALMPIPGLDGVAVDLSSLL